MPLPTVQNWLGQAEIFQNLSCPEREQAALGSPGKAETKIQSRGIFPRLPSWALGSWDYQLEVDTGAQAGAEATLLSQRGCQVGTVVEGLPLPLTPLPQH